MCWLFMRLQGRDDPEAGSPVNWPNRSSRASPRPEEDHAAIHEITGLAIALVILASAIGNAHAQTAADMLAEADRLAWLKNWSRAEPLFSKADEMFTAAGDERNALYARISAIRGRLPQLRLIEVLRRSPKLTHLCSPKVTRAFCADATAPARDDNDRSSRCQRPGRDHARSAAGGSGRVCEQETGNGPATRRNVSPLAGRRRRRSGATGTQAMPSPGELTGARRKHNNRRSRCDCRRH